MLLAGCYYVWREALAPLQPQPHHRFALPLSLLVGDPMQVIALRSLLVRHHLNGDSPTVEASKTRVVRQVNYQILNAPLIPFTRRFSRQANCPQSGGLAPATTSA